MRAFYSLAKPRTRARKTPECLSALLQGAAEVGLAAVDLEAGVGDFGGGLGEEESAAVEQGKRDEGGEEAEEGLHQAH